MKFRDLFKRKAGKNKDRAKDSESVKLDTEDQIYEESEDETKELNRLDDEVTEVQTSHQNTSFLENNSDNTTERLDKETPSETFTSNANDVSRGNRPKRAIFEYTESRVETAEDVDEDRGAEDTILALKRKERDLLEKESREETVLDETTEPLTEVLVEEDSNQREESGEPPERIDLESYLDQKLQETSQNKSAKTEQVAVRESQQPTELERYIDQRLGVSSPETTQPESGARAQEKETAPQRLTNLQSKDQRQKGSSEEETTRLESTKNEQKSETTSRKPTNFQSYLKQILNKSSQSETKPSTPEQEPETAPQRPTNLQSSLEQRPESSSEKETVEPEELKPEIESQKPSSLEQRLESSSQETAQEESSAPEQEPETVSQRPTSLQSYLEQRLKRAQKETSKPESTKSEQKVESQKPSDLEQSLKSSSQETAQEESSAPEQEPETAPQRPTSLQSYLEQRLKSAQKEMSKPESTKSEQKVESQKPSGLEQSLKSSSQETVQEESSAPEQEPETGPQRPTSLQSYLEQRLKSAQKETSKPESTKSEQKMESQKPSGLEQRLRSSSKQETTESTKKQESQGKSQDYIDLQNFIEQRLKSSPQERSRFDSDYQQKLVDLQSYLEQRLESPAQEMTRLETADQQELVNLQSFIEQSLSDSSEESLFESTENGLGSEEEVRRSIDLQSYINQRTSEEKIRRESSASLQEPVSLPIGEEQSESSTQTATKSQSSATEQAPEVKSKTVHRLPNFQSYLAEKLKQEVASEQEAPASQVEGKPVHKQEDFNAYLNERIKHDLATAESEETSEIILTSESGEPDQSRVEYETSLADKLKHLTTEEKPEQETTENITETSGKEESKPEEPKKKRRISVSNIFKRRRKKEVEEPQMTAPLDSIMKQAQEDLEVKPIQPRKRRSELLIPRNLKEESAAEESKEDTEITLQFNAVNLDESSEVSEEEPPTQQFILLPSESEEKEETSLLDELNAKPILEENLRRGIEEEQTATINTESATSTSTRRKDVQRQLRRQEKASQERKRSQTKDITQSFRRSGEKKESLIFANVPDNILKGGILLFNNLARQMESSGTLRVESLMSVLGSLAGYSIQAGIREKMVNRLKISEDQVFSVVETKNGERYFFGDPVDRALQKDRSSLWYMVASATQKLVGSVETNVDEIVRYTTRNIGSESFGIPRLPKNHRPNHTPQYYVEHMWEALVPGLERFTDDPLQWPLIFSVALQRALICTKNILDPNLSLRIITESAIPMTIANIVPIKSGVTEFGEETEPEKLREQIEQIRNSLKLQLSQEQRQELLSELSIKTEQLYDMISPRTTVRTEQKKV